MRDLLRVLVCGDDADSRTAFAMALASDFIEVFVDAPLEVAESRDPKACTERHGVGSSRTSQVWTQCTRCPSTPMYG